MHAKRIALFLVSYVLPREAWGGVYGQLWVTLQSTVAGCLAECKVTFVIHQAWLQF